MPKTLFPPSSLRLSLTVACLSALTLGGCSTTKKTADATAEAPQSQVAKPGSAKGILAKGGMTANNRYVDPVISKAPGQQQQAQAPAAHVPAAEAAFPAPPEQPASIAGLATQPTNVRAGSGSIFSSAPPTATEPSTTASAPVAPRRNFNATAASVYSTQQAMPGAACGEDPRGNPISC